MSNINLYLTIIKVIY